MSNFFDEDTLEQNKKLWIENKILREGFLSVTPLQIEELQKKYTYDCDLKGYYSIDGKRLEDDLQRNAEKYGGKWQRLTPEDAERRRIKDEYRKYFDPQAEGYSIEPESSSWYKRLELYRSHRDLAEELHRQYNK